MIFVTGDCHGDFGKFNRDSFPEQKNLTKEDVVIICGDFGGVWQRTPDKNENYWLNWLETRNFTTLVVPGNHENYERISGLPRKEWKGGSVGVVRPSVLIADRGEVFNINGVKVFCFGGARSHDISDGILDYDDENWRKKAKILETRGKYMYRVKGLSWWEEEMPSEEEMEHARDVLAAHGYKVDLIITHCAPSSVQTTFLPYGDYDYLNDFLNEIKHTVTYDRWWFGHYHFDAPIDEKHGCLYRYILPWDNERELIQEELIYR